MISYSEALQLIREQGARATLAAETISIEDIAGRICAEDIAAPRANQPFDNSSRDGFAVRAADLAAAAQDRPVTLRLAAHIAAGDAPLMRKAAAGECFEIMTGAPLPPGCDAVVQVEDAALEKGSVVFLRPAGINDNVRRAGGDFSVGDSVLNHGQLLRADHVLALATLGISQIKVKRRPKVAILSTGLEIVDDLTAELAAGQIYNASAPHLRAAVKLWGMDVVACHTVADDPALYRQRVREAVAAGCDVILSTGAVSAGVHDFVPGVLKDIGAETFFHKIAVRPGRPLLFARLSEGPFFFGLPGNPASTAAGLRFFVYPLLRAMQGLEAEIPERAVLTADYKKGNSGLLFFLRAERDKTGGVRIPRDQQSFMVSPFLRTNAWTIAAEDVESLKTGDTVDIYAAELACL